MALATGTLFEVRASATTGNVNGSGFNTGNANFPTDATATSATGNSPVISSASYTFVAGDVGAWVYIKSGTNWTPGFYQISSVGGGAATVNASIGAAIQLNTATNLYQASTVAGCATTASPTGGTFGVDFSQQDTADSTITDAASLASSTTLTSATNPWKRVSVGNFFHLTTSGTGGFGLVGWYEIVTFTSAGQVTTDRTTNSGTALVAGTGQTGGAGRLNGLEDEFGEMLPAGAVVYIKNGSYTPSASITIASAASTATNPIMWLGFNSLRGDTCNGSNRPVFTFGANSFTTGGQWIVKNLSITGTAAAVFTGGTGTSVINCKVTNTSTTTTRVAFTSGANSTTAGCELISQNGSAYSVGASGGTRVIGCYIHDSSTGLSSTTGGLNVSASLLEANDANTLTTAALGNAMLNHCTFYGREAKTTGGLAFTGTSSTGKYFVSNIFYGLGTALNFTTLQPVDMGVNNNYFNNTTDATNFYKSPDALALNPGFVGASQVTGTTATTSGSVLTQSGGDFSSVTDNVDYLHVLSGTGVTTGIYLITSHTSTTLTVNNALGTSNGGDVVYYVTTGHNFAIGTALKAMGFPSFSAMGIETVSYVDVGAIQRQEPSTAATFIG